MPGKGRPRVSPEALQERIASYCARYRVTPKADALPPFPSGQRETTQHREWLGLYKAQQRMSVRRRHAGADAAHAPAAEDAGGGTGVDKARCPVCRRTLDLEDEGSSGT